MAELREKRAQLSTSILTTLHKRAEVLKWLFSPVQAKVDDEPQIREALGVQFSVRLSFDAFTTRLFDFIKKNVGSFVNQEESRPWFAVAAASLGRLGEPPLAAEWHHGAIDAPTPAKRRPTRHQFSRKQ